MEISTLRQQIENLLKEMGYELSSLNFVSNKEKTLSLVVDRVEPINMDDITLVSEKVSSLLDELDPFDVPYTLDVSSLGVEKPLKVESLSSYINKYVHVHLINPIEGNNIYEGDLSSVTDDSIQITYKVKTRTKVVDITKSNISKIRLAIKF